MLKLSVCFAAIAVPLQIVVGDLHGLKVRDHQPMKLAAIEGHWETCARCVADPVRRGRTRRRAMNRYEVSVPKLGSLILTHDIDGEVAGLKEVEPRAAAASRTGVLQLPHHGRHRHPDALAHRVVGAAVATRPVVRIEARVARVDVDDARGVRRGARRLVHDGDRAPAIRRLRPAAHIAGGDRDRRRQRAHVVDRLRDGVLVRFISGTYYLLKLLRKGPQPVEQALLHPEEKTAQRPLGLPEELLEDGG